MTDKILTPAQKGAATRAKNKAAKEAAAAAEKPTLDAENTPVLATITPDAFEEVSTGELNVVGSVAAANTVTVQLPPVVQTVVDAIDTVGNSTDFQVTASRVTSKFSAKVRNALYTIGIVLGSIAGAAGIVIPILTGNVQLYAASAVGIAYALSNLLAKLNLSKTAADISAEKARGLPA